MIHLANKHFYFYFLLLEFCACAPVRDENCTHLINFTTCGHSYALFDIKTGHTDREGQVNMHYPVKLSAPITKTKGNQGAKAISHDSEIRTEPCNLYK